MSITPVNRGAEDCKALLIRIAGRDHNAFEHLHACYRAFVFGIATRLLGDPLSAEEVAQDVFMELWRQPPSAPVGATSLMAWLAVVTRSRCWRILNRMPPHLSIETFPEDSFAYCDTAFNHIVETRLRAKLESAFRQVDEDQQVILELIYRHGMGPTEISRHLGVPLITIRRQVRLLTTQLRRRVAA